MRHILLRYFPLLTRNGRDDIVSKYAYQLMNYKQLVALAQSILKYCDSFSKSKFYAKLLKDAIGVELRPPIPRHVKMEVDGEVMGSGGMASIFGGERNISCSCYLMHCGGIFFVLPQLDQAAGAF